MIYKHDSYYMPPYFEIRLAGPVSASENVGFFSQELFLKIFALPGSILFYATLELFIHKSQLKT